MALDVEKLIADTQAARAAAEAQKAEADKVNAALKASRKANQGVRVKVDDRLNYANSLSQTIADIESKLTIYGTRIGRGDKLTPGEQKEFDTLVKQYKSANTTYQKTVKEVDAILAKAPSPTSVEVKGGRTQVAPTAEEKAAEGKPQTEEALATATSVAQINTQLDKLLKNPREFIFNMSPAERINLAKTLTAAGYPTPEVNGQFNDGIVANYKLAISNTKAWNTANKDLAGYTPVDLTGFLTYRTGLLKSQGEAGTGGAGGISNYIYSPTEAKSLISKVVTSLLNREATDKEINSISKKLMAAQKASPSKTVNGVTTGRLDAEQFVTDIIKSGSEFASKLKAKQDLTAQGIVAVAKANGLKLTADEIRTYADRIKNGEDAKTIENQLRAVASLGQPDAIKKLMADGTNLETIYAPYKRALATSLGLNEDTISLDDPTLRMAIGPDREMSLYDYKKAIRQDSRWKYSQEANDEVTSMINQVKRDFGFMG